MSKMSNLKKGVVGVCAATMLTGLCAVPAFAADNEAATTLMLDTSQIGQISLTVPTGSVKGAVQVDGVTKALSITFADGNAYSITNTSTLPVKLTNAKVTPDASSKINLIASSDFASDTATKNALAMEATYDTESATNKVDFSAAKDSGANIADAKSIPTGDSISITLTGQIKNPDSSVVQADAFKAFDVVWTVGLA